jgi:hypothetical protein
MMLKNINNLTLVSGILLATLTVVSCNNKPKVDDSAPKNTGIKSG